jgi:hypothetical protein
MELIKESKQEKLIKLSEMLRERQLGNIRPTMIRLMPLKCFSKPIERILLWQLDVVLIQMNKQRRLKKWV